jgi:hypothetical protein
MITPTSFSVVPSTLKSTWWELTTKSPSILTTYRRRPLPPHLAYLSSLHVLRTAQRRPDISTLHGRRSPRTRLLFHLPGRHLSLLPAIIFRFQKVSFVTIFMITQWYDQKSVL